MKYKLYSKRNSPIHAAEEGQAYTFCGEHTGWMNDITGKFNAKNICLVCKPMMIKIDKDNDKLEKWKAATAKIVL